MSSAFAHYGEERVLSGRRGSGTIFFEGCGLRCVFCQNYDISHFVSRSCVNREELVEMMLRLELAGCHNINLVTPTHFAHIIAEAIPQARRRGLSIPTVYNCGGYESVETLRALEGLIDIYMPDVKFFDRGAARRYLQAADYPSVVRAALVEMHRQVGDLVINSAGIAKRGLLVRHLVMPDFIEDSRAIVRFLSRVSRRTFLNVMGQYRPEGEAHRFPRIARRPSYEEIAIVREEALRLGLRLG